MLAFRRCLCPFGDDELDLLDSSEDSEEYLEVLVEEHECTDRQCNLCKSR